MIKNIEKLQMWIACCLTMGEWGIAIFVLIYHGDVVMLYLAITYLLRETRGGHRYHEMIQYVYLRVKGMRDAD